jgi:hypothetical protein
VLVSEPYAGDLGSPVIPDPGLTMSEAVNMEGTIRQFLSRSTERGDAVLASGCEKLVASLKQAMTEHPDEWELVEREVEMQKQLRDEAPDA